MSDMKYYIGSIKKITVPKKYDTFEKQVDYLISKGYTLDDVDIDDEWFYVDDSDVVRINGWWYALDKTEFDPDNLMEFTPKGSGGEFKVSFYNGGTCLNEVLEELLEQNLEN